MLFQFINWSSNLFKDLSQPDSIVVILYLTAAFLLGAISMWWMKRKELAHFKKSMEKQNADLEFLKNKNGELALQVELQNAKQAEKEKEQPDLISDLNLQVTELKQAHYFLKKDYDLALVALHSAKEQAEEWQKAVMGSNILPQTISPAEIDAARQKIKRYLKQKLSQQSEELSFKKEVTQIIGAERIAPIDQLDEDMLVAFAELIPDEG